MNLILIVLWFINFLTAIKLKPKGLRSFMFIVHALSQTFWKPNVDFNLPLEPIFPLFLHQY